MINAIGIYSLSSKSNWLNDPCFSFYWRILLSKTFLVRILVWYFSVWSKLLQYRNHFKDFSDGKQKRFFSILHWCGKYAMIDRSSLSDIILA